MQEAIAIIGAGNMGASLLGGMLANGIASKQLCISDTDEKKLQMLAEKFHVQVTTDNFAAVQSAKIIILAVKPQIMAQVAAEIASLVQLHKPLIISIAAGVRVASLQQWLGEQVAIVRCMPNTPALIRAGISALYPNLFVSANQRTLAETILTAVGTVVWLEEEKMLDVVTAVSGSGPAYFFFIIEALQQAGEKLGLPAQTARLLAMQTALGAARMVVETGQSAAELRRQVTSPAGTTEAALRVLEQEKMATIFFAAVDAAKKRAEELAKNA